MKKTLARKLTISVLAALSSAAFAQVPDLVTALDAGGRSMGAGGALGITGISTLSVTSNPAAIAYASRTEVGIAARTLPTSETRVTGPLNDLRLSTDTTTGDYHLTHVGVILPLKSKGGNQGAVGIAGTTTGWFHDTQRGNNLPNGIASYRDFTRARTDLITVSYGMTSQNLALAWGLGFVVARQNVRNFEQINFSDGNIPPQIADTDTTGNGLGFQAGLMYTPPERPDVTLAVSARTPIRIRSSASPINLYDRIPGRLAVGAAIRRDGFRSGSDYLILGGEVQHFFDGHDSPRIDRSEQTAGGVGAEYNYDHGSAFIPVRVGYAFIPKGGEDFRSRNGLTYGIGYRPKNGDFTIEVNFGRPQGGGTETGIYLSYRLKK